MFGVLSRKAGFGENNFHFFGDRRKKHNVILGKPSKKRAW